MSSTPSPSRGVRHVIAIQALLTSDRRSPPINNSEAITASSRPRRCAVVWDSTPRLVRAGLQVARDRAENPRRARPRCSGAAIRAVFNGPGRAARATVAVPTRGAVRGQPRRGPAVRGELGPKPDGGDGQGGGGGRAARLEELAEVDGQRGVGQPGRSPRQASKLPQRAEL